MSKSERPAIEFGIEGIDDRAEGCRTELVIALCVRAKIDRLRESVAEVEGEAGAGDFARGQLQCVITAGPDRGPGIQRGKLPLVKACRDIPIGILIRAASETTRALVWVTIRIQNGERKRLVSDDGLRLVDVGVDVLSCALTAVGEIGKQVFPIRDWLHGSGASNGRLGEKLARLKIVHPRLWIDQVERFGQCQLLQQVTPEGANVVRFNGKPMRNFSLNGEIVGDRIWRFDFVVDAPSDG